MRGIDAMIGNGAHEEHIYTSFNVAQGDNIGIIDLYPYKGMDYRGDLELSMPLVVQLWGPQGMYI